MSVLATLIDELREATTLHMKATHAEMIAKRRVMDVLQRVGQHQRAVGELAENVLLGYINPRETLSGVKAKEDEDFDTPVYVALLVAEEDGDEDEEKEEPCQAN